MSDDPAPPRLTDRLKERAFSLHAQATSAEAAGDLSAARKLHAVADQFNQISDRVAARRSNANPTPDTPPACT